MRVQLNFRDASFDLLSGRKRRPSYAAAIAEYRTLYDKRNLDYHALYSCSGSANRLKPVLFQMMIATKSPSNLPTSCPSQFNTDWMLIRARLRFCSVATKRFHFSGSGAAASAVKSVGIGRS